MARQDTTAQDKPTQRHIGYDTIRQEHVRRYETHQDNA